MAEANILIVEQMEMELRSELFSAIAENSRDAIVILDTDCIITFWNTAAEVMFKYSKKEALGMRFTDIILEHYIEDFIIGFNKSVSNGKSEIFNRILELYVKKKNRTVFPIELKLTEIKLLGKWHACGIIRDVTERMSSEEELTRLIEELQVSKDIIEQHASELITLNDKLIESEEQLKELNASKDKFFSIIAHDLKSPFQGLLGYAQLLATNVGNLTNDEISEFANNLNESAQQMFKLLENLLQWSRIQRGKMEYAPEIIVLHQIADLNVALIQSRAEQKRVRLCNNVDPSLLAYGDVNMVNTIIRNLMSNAVKFTREGDEIGITAKVIDGETVEITVYDTGVGMSQMAMERAFRIDTHYTSIGTNNETGTGLGLILCKELIEMNNGNIRIDSKIGEGARFTFTLPYPPIVH